MASRTLGELLLRPSSFTRSTCPHGIQRLAPTYRSISNNTPPQPVQPPRKEDTDNSNTNTNDSFSEPTGPFSRNPQPPSSPQSETSQAIDSLFNSLPRRQPPTSSSDDLRTARSQHIFAEWSGPGRGRGSRGPPKFDFNSMDMPDTLLNPSLANKPSSASSLAVQQEETFGNYPRLNPTYGRTVELDASRGRDIVRGIGMLGSLVARNKLKSDFHKQKFHERGGLKRKRLLSERWRARFKVGFREVTGRVTELTRKGW